MLSFFPILLLIIILAGCQTAAAENEANPQSIQVQPSTTESAPSSLPDNPSTPIVASPSANSETSHFLPELPDEVVPSPSPEVSSDSDPEGLDEDLEEYAEYYGITLEEARQRMEVIDSIPGTLERKLFKNEPQSFAGLWIQNSPEFKIVLAFTQDGTEILQKYAEYIPEDLMPYIEIKTVQYTRAELMDIEESFRSVMQNADVPFNMGVDIMNNGVQVEVEKAYQDQFENYLQTNEIAIPTGVSLKYASDVLAHLD